MTMAKTTQPAGAGTRVRGTVVLVLALACALSIAPALAAPAAGARETGAGRASRASSGAARSASRYPAAATRSVPTAGAAAAKRRHKKRRKPALHGNPARALLAFEAMQSRYYIAGSGLYVGEPFSYLWPFSQALAATVTLANVPALQRTALRQFPARLAGLQAYLDLNNSGAPEGTYTSGLPAYDGTVSPPAGPGGPKYYDDNDWIGIELVRMYKLTGKAPLLGAAEGIMAFEMAGWQTDPTLACAGGIPFVNLPSNTDRNTVTTAPAAELAAQLYGVTRDPSYLQFAEQAYQWVRRCLLQPNGLYADHLNLKGYVEKVFWSYNQGTMIGAGALLYQATGNSGYLYDARQTAKAALAYFGPQRLGEEIPFFPSVYFRNLMYLDSITHDPPGQRIAQAYVDYAWGSLRLSNNIFVAGSPAGAQLLVQSAITQIYGLLSSPPSTYF
jgi:hypothetical protein